MIALLVLALFVIALLLVGWFELKREPHIRRVARVLASLVVVGALLLLVILRGTQAVRHILTPGAPVAARGREAIGLERLASPALLWSGRDARDLHLAGWGLRAHEWPDSLATNVTLEAAPLPDGIVSLDVPTEIGLGERLVVSGQLNLHWIDSAWVCLDDPAGPRDSVHVGGRSPRFQLSDWPRAATAAEYRLRVRAGSETLSNDTIGIAVREARPPAVLVLDGSPSFESTFLKRWLADRGGSVTIRTAISRDKYRTENINPQTTPMGPQVGQIGPSILGQYDAVLIDGTALLALTPSEATALQNAVQRDGLGVLITADAAKAAASAFGTGLTGSAAGEDDWSVKPQWSEAPRRSSLAILAEPMNLAGGQPLIRDPQGRLLAATRSAGQGRIGVTLLKTPSRWVLEGEQDLYGSYWQQLLSAVARDTVTRVTISADGPRRPDQPVTVTLTIPRVARAIEEWPRPTLTGPDGEVDTLGFARDPVDPRLWHSTYWPHAAGWHMLKFAGGRTVPFRVSQPGEWIGLEASARRLASVARLGRQAATHTSVADRLPLRLVAFLLIVGVLSWLWIEPRMPR